MSRSVNQATIIGHLTRDPEMRYTPQGNAVTSFGVATNRTWVAEGEKKEEVEFHNVVAWNKLAELCNQMLRKGRKVYIQGRLRTQSWEGQDGAKRNRTEIVAEEMVLLDNKYTDDEMPPVSEPADAGAAPAPTESKKPSALETDATITEDDIPF